MRYFRFVLLSIAFACFTGIAISQDIDPESQKLIDKYKSDNENIPKEVANLMPPVVKTAEQRWTVEPSTNMLLEARLEGNDDGPSTKNLDYTIIVNVFNVKNPLGKSTANSSLKQMRDTMLNDWKKDNPVGKDGPMTRNPYEKISVTKGYILMQKIFIAKHKDGEGTVPESTTYAGFLYMEPDNGVLTARTSVSADKKVLEGMLRHTATGAAKIRWDKYFK